jgi:hypothetical protein
MAILRTNCPHCRVNHVAAYIVWQDGDAQRKIFLARCGACSLPITGSALNPFGFDRDFVKSVGDIEIEGWHVLETWPEMVQLTAPVHTPDAIGRRYIEGEEAFRRGNWNAAVAMYRSALDIGTKAMADVPPKLNFFQRLQWLHQNHRITPEMREWADHVRVDGNEALHEPDEFTQADAEPLRLFTETFLKYAYSLPGEVAIYRTQTAHLD